MVSWHEWRLGDNPLDSAQKFIENRGETYHVALLDVPPAPGTQVLAFQITDFVQEWARNTQEFAMDSTYKLVTKFFTLSDKNWSEINAMGAVWPKAKHQLCFWHVLRAVKQRLAKAREQPAHYYPEEAHKEFPYILCSFVPKSDQTQKNEVHTMHYPTLQSLISF